MHKCSDIKKNRSHLYMHFNEKVDAININKLIPSAVSKK